MQPVIFRTPPNPKIDFRRLVVVLAYRMYWPAMDAFGAQRRMRKAIKSQRSFVGVLQRDSDRQMTPFSQAVRKGNSTGVAWQCLVGSMLRQFMTRHSKPSATITDNHAFRFPTARPVPTLAGLLLRSKT